MSTEEAKSPSQTRPRLGRRSLTADPTFPSSPKKAVPGRSSIDSPKKQKQHHHHLPFFHASNNEQSHRSHISHHRAKKGEDVANSKTSSRQHLPNMNPVDGLVTIISHASGEKRSSNGQSPVRQEDQETETESRLQRARAVPVRPGQVDRERERARLREKELRSSLDDLSDLATGTTQRLDYTYYAVLEKAGQLHSTISQLQELSDSSRALLTQFEGNVHDVDRDIHQQVAGFRGFAAQQTDVEELTSRLKEAKTKTDSLSARLEGARKRVDVWEAREKEWQSKTSKRLTFSWVCTVIFVALVVMIVLWRRIEYMIPKSTLQASKITNESMPGFIAEDLAAFRSIYASANLTGPDARESSLPTDRRLAEFDEL